MDTTQQFHPHKPTRSHVAYLAVFALIGTFTAGIMAGSGSTAFTYQNRASFDKKMEGKRLPVESFQADSKTAELNKIQNEEKKKNTKVTGTINDVPRSKLRGIWLRK